MIAYETRTHKQSSVPVPCVLDLGRKGAPDASSPTLGLLGSCVKAI